MDHPPMRATCYQYEKKIEASDGEPQDTDPPRNYLVRPVERHEAAAFIRAYEYLGTVGHPQARIGAHDPLTGKLAAVALFGKPAQTTPDDTIVLERGACAPWAHPHTASWFIPRAVRMAHETYGWKIFVAYADPEAGEIGTVYQAANWLYVGQGSPGRLTGGRPRKRDLFRERESGRVIIDRTFYRSFDKRYVDIGEWERLQVEAKHKYIWIEAPRRERRELLKRFSPLPYPKRPDSR